MPQFSTVSVRMSSKMRLNRGKLSGSRALLWTRLTKNLPIACRPWIAYRLEDKKMLTAVHWHMDCDGDKLPFRGTKQNLPWTWWVAWIDAQKSQRKGTGGILQLTIRLDGSCQMSTNSKPEYHCGREQSCQMRDVVITQELIGFERPCDAKETGRITAMTRT